jgi:hypothetical protein
MNKLSGDAKVISEVVASSQLTAARDRVIVHSSNAKTPTLMHFQHIVVSPKIDKEYRIILDKA